MRQKRGLALLVGIMALCLSLDAQSQQIGAVPGEGGGFDPSAVATPRSKVFGVDPFANVNFNACLQQADAADPGPRFNPLEFGVPTATEMATAGVAGVLAGVLGGGTAGVAGLLGIQDGAACKGPLPDVADIPTGCENYKKADGTFDADALSAKLTVVRNASGSADCKIRNSKRAEHASECFKTGFQKLKEHMDEVKKDFDESIRRMKLYEAGINAEVKKEEGIQGQLEPKALQLREQAAAVKQLVDQFDADGVDGIPGVQALKDLVKTQRDNVVKFNLQVRAAKANKTGECLKNGGGTSSSGIRACPNSSGDLLPPKECVLSIFRDQEALRLSGGSNRISPADAKKAEFAKKIFENRLNQMLDDLTRNPPRVDDADQFAARYGGELAQFGNAGQQMLNELQACKTDVLSDIEEDLTNPGGDLGSTAAGLSSNADEITKQSGRAIGKLDGALRDAGAAIFNGELNEKLNGAGCVKSTIAANPSGANAAPAKVVFQANAFDKQLNCVEGAVENLRALMNGTVPPGSDKPLNVNLQVNGLSAAQASCKGLRDCADKAEKVLANSKVRVDNLKGEGFFPDNKCKGGQCPGIARMRADANVNIRAALQTAADDFKQRIAAAKVQFAQVKSLLGLTGAKDLPDPETPSTNVDDVCPDGPEICKIPGKFSDVLGGLGGMQSINEESLSTPINTARDQAAEAEAKKQVFADKGTAIKSALTTCQKAADDASRTKKLAAKDDEFSDLLQRCKNAVRQTAQVPPDFAPRFLDLENSLVDICKTADNAKECTKLKSSMQLREAECQQVAEDRGNKFGEDADRCLAQLDTATGTLSAALSAQKANPSDQTNEAVRRAQARVDQLSKKCQSASDKASRFIN